MKVLIIHPSFYTNGGAEKVIVRLANYLTEHHIPNTILTTEMCGEVRSQLFETRLLLCKDFNEMSYVLQQIKNDFDVINIHNSPCELMSFGIKIPTVWCCNEPPEEWLRTKCLSRRQIEIVKKFIKKVIVADQYNKERFEKIYEKFAEVIPYGIDHEFFKEGNAESFKNKYGLKDEFVISQVGWVHPRKNQERTIEIFRMVKQKLPNAKLFLAGNQNYEYKKELDVYIKNYGLEDDVVFTGFISQEEVRDLIHASDVVLHPIRDQGGWLTVFDVMSAAKPVLVSDEATCSSLLKENELGWVCNNNLEFIKVISEISEGKYKEVLLEDQKWVKENLSWKNYCDKMIESFKEVIE